MRLKTILIKPISLSSPTTANSSSSIPETAWMAGKMRVQRVNQCLRGGGLYFPGYIEAEKAGVRGKSF
jgi:hypothetical protein